MPLHAAAQEQISAFLKAIRAFGITEFETFSTPDLHERKNIPQVVSAIHALGRTVQAKLPDFEPKLGIKVVEKRSISFSEKQLREAEAAVSVLNLGSSDAGKKAAAAVLDGTGEVDEEKAAAKRATEEARLKEIAAAATPKE